MPLPPGPGPDTNQLPKEPGDKQKAGTAGKQKAVPRKTFNESIGHGNASGGQGQLLGTGGTGDPTIDYPVALTWAKPMGKGGAAGQPYQTGKQPLNYNYNGNPTDY